MLPAGSHGAGRPEPEPEPEGGPGSGNDLLGLVSHLSSWLNRVISLDSSVFLPIIVVVRCRASPTSVPNRLEYRSWQRIRLGV